ncbi:hypothetical protein [Deinococcus hopiensis]|nr:hypothetical protein [Deinococcus hopiensis]
MVKTLEKSALFTSRKRFVEKDGDMSVEGDEPMRENKDLNPVKLAALLGMSVAELAQAVGSDAAVLQRESATISDLQSKLHPVAMLAHTLTQQLGSPESVRLWLRLPNAELDGLLPITFVLEGHAKDLEPLVRLSAEGVFS